MIKKRFITLSIMVLALIAVVGAGFSSWQFSNQRRADVFSNVVVTHANTFGQFSNVSNGSYLLMLDQPTKNESSNITAHNISLRSGTSETNSNNVDSLTGTWTVSLPSYKDTLKNGTDGVSIENSYIEYSIIVYIKTETLGQYVEIGNSTGFSKDGNLHPVAGSHNHRNEGYTAYKLTLSNLTDGTNDLVFADIASNTNPLKTGAYVTLPSDDTSDVVVNFRLDLASVPFQWISGKAPNSFQDYQTMVKTLNCKDVSTVDDVKGGQTYQTEGKDIIFEFCVYNTTPGAPVIDVVTN